MKRFHVHMNVADLQSSIAFYTRLFGAGPARVEADYAKWMLEDPRVNFAISARGARPGLDHLGFQTDSADELAEMKASAEQALMPTLDEGETTCCYARSEKHWIVDPTGVPWEHFHTLGAIPVFNEAAPADGAACCAPAPAAAHADAADTACCAPAPRGKPVAIPVRGAGSSSCC